MTGALLSSQKYCSLAGFSLLLAAVTFWIAWVLMPGVGITDAALILQLVSENRNQVLLSSVIQLLSSACFAPLPFALMAVMHRKNSTMLVAGTILLLIGAMGVAADAIFHLLAYEMVGPGTERPQMLLVMRRMQEVDLLWILPLIGAFFIGAVLLAIGLARCEIVSLWNPALYGLALILALAGGPLAKAQGISPRLVGLGVLGLVSISLAWIGFALSFEKSTIRVSSST
jgi:hypothetical protein